MKAQSLHHVSLVTANLPRAVAFYRDLLEFQQISRPPFAATGAWLVSGAVEIHLIDQPGGTYRNRMIIDTDDVHYAIRVDDFEETVAELKAKGFREDAGDEDQMRLLVKRKGTAGYPQAYLRDPDNHTIEINAKA